MTAILQGVRILEVAEHTFVPAASAILADCMSQMRIAVVRASSGLGRCLGIGLAQRGAKVALLARVVGNDPDGGDHPLGAPSDSMTTRSTS